MCVRGYLNGDGNGYTTHISLFFVIMKGEFDNLLHWPFEYKVSMILVGEQQTQIVSISVNIPFPSYTAIR